MNDKHLLTLIFIFTVSYLIIWSIDSSLESNTNSDKTLKRSDLPERTEDVSELTKIFYISVRDALPTEDIPFPDLERLEDALEYKDVVIAMKGTQGIAENSEWSMGVSDIGDWRGSGWNGKAFETITGRFRPVNGFNDWMHGKYKSKGDGYKLVNLCDSNLDRQIREESRPRDETIKVIPGGKSIVYKDSMAHWSESKIKNTNGVRGSEEVHRGVYSGKGAGENYWSLTKGTLGCVTKKSEGWGIPNLRDIFDGAQSMHNGGIIGGTGIGYDDVERYSENGFIIDARITLMRLVASKDEALKDPDAFISRLNSIVNGKNENTVDIDALITIGNEPAFSAISIYKPEYKNDIDVAKRLYNKINTKITILKKNVTNNLKSDSNPNPDINDLKDAIDEIKENARINEYLIQFVADAEDNYKILEDEYEEIYRYSNNLKSRILLSLPNENRPYPNIDNLQNILDVSFKSEDSKRICRSEDGCRRFLGETFSYDAELKLEWLKNQEDERIGERLIAKNNADDSIIEYENMINDFVCVKDPSLKTEADSVEEKDLGDIEMLVKIGVDPNDKPSGELFDHESCGVGERARRIASYGRQSLLYSRMIMFNIINLAYEQEQAGIITVGQLNVQKALAIQEASRGIQGLRGPKGEKGDRGFIGSSGRDGSRGIQGIRGNRGRSGTPGTSGRDGKAGVDGLKGAIGPKGTTGESGRDGKAGVDGLKGAIGPKGTTGESGRDGSEGERGDRGFKGFAGIDGKRGDMGDKGDTGDRGLKGFAGIDGKRGDMGDKGDTGDRGLRVLQELTENEDLGELEVQAILN